MTKAGPKVLRGLKEAVAHAKRDESHLPLAEQSLVFRLRKRAEIRRSNTERKSVLEGRADRVSDLLEEAATEIAALHARRAAATNELSQHGLYFSWVTGHPDMVQLCVKATGKFYDGSPVASPSRDGEK